jgi:hypothetical protein
MAARFDWNEQKLNVSGSNINLGAKLNWILGAVILSKSNGIAVTEAEAKGILGRYGPIELLAATNTAIERAGTCQGMYVRFAYYLDCRDALRVSGL